MRNVHSLSSETCEPSVHLSRNLKTQPKPDPSVPADNRRPRLSFFFNLQFSKNPAKPKSSPLGQNPLPGTQPQSIQRHSEYRTNYSIQRRKTEPVQPNPKENPRNPTASSTFRQSRTQRPRPVQTAPAPTAVVDERLIGRPGAVGQQPISKNLSPARFFPRPDFSSPAPSQGPQGAFQCTCAGKGGRLAMAALPSPPFMTPA